MSRFVVFIYGGLAYLLFLLTFGYMAGFLVNLFVPKGINDAGIDLSETVLCAIAVNLSLVALFGVLHSLLARDWVKEKLYRILPPSAERSTYVVQSSLCLALAMWLWQPLAAPIWDVDGAWQILPFATFGVGTAIVLWSTFLIDHFELFGLRQIWTHMRGQKMPEPEFKTPALYRLVRHPMQLGIVILLFSTPHMTAGHLLFSGAMTGYIFVGLYFEERALLRSLESAMPSTSKTSRSCFHGFSQCLCMERADSAGCLFCPRTFIAHMRMTIGCRCAPSASHLKLGPVQGIVP